MEPRPDSGGSLPSSPQDADGADAVLALNHDKSERGSGCPTPRPDRAHLTADGELLPIRCKRNRCPSCRPRNVQVTAAMMGLNAARSAKPPRVAVLSTTREWVEDATLREGWKEVARRARKYVDPDASYAWFREWTEGRNDGVRRTHYHSTWSTDAVHGEALAEISREVWSRLTGAYSPKAHGHQPIWDAGGLARYVAGLAGHHLKSNQAPPPGWSGRRFGTSRGFYATDALELRKEAEAAVRDERIAFRLRQAIEPPHLTAETIIERMQGAELDAMQALRQLVDEHYDQELTQLLEEVRKQPPVRVVRIKPGTFGTW